MTFGEQRPMGTRNEYTESPAVGRPVLMGLVIAVDDPRRGDIPAVLEQHLMFSRMVTPASGVHALALEDLLDPAVTFFSARFDGDSSGSGPSNSSTRLMPS